LFGLSVEDCIPEDAESSGEEHVTKRVFVSDVHMSAGWSLNRGAHSYDWFDEVEAETFAKFLENLIADDTVNEVILLGDIMDVWVYPYDIPPAQYSDIAAAGHLAPIFDALRALSEKKTVTYVSGNHDINIGDAGLSAFRQSTFGPKMQFASFYDGEEDGIIAYHGHEYAMWNAPDPGGRNPPFGYYVSRMIATIDSLGKARYTFGNVATSLFSHPGSIGAMFVNAPLDFLMNQANMTDRSKFVTPGGTITLREVRKAYAGLADDWIKYHGIDGPVRSIRREAAGLWDAATNLAWGRKKKVVVFGHTHEEENCVLSPPGEHAGPYAIYANSGSWCRFNDHSAPKPYTYIVAEYDGTTHTVTTMHWGGRQGASNSI
jgi:UDP-2,3-diacylglucosamine pyrophosphatase LpxH